MKLILKTIKQEIFELEIPDDNITVSNLKELIENQYNYDKTKLKLIFNSLVLENEKLLKDYNIVDGFTLVMANLKKKENLINTENNINNNQNDDLGLYSENIDSNVNQEDEEEQILQADIKAENAVQYVASIMKILCLKSPEKGKEFFKNFEEDNPEVMQLIKKNDAEFKRLLYSPKTNEDVKIYKSFYKGELNETEEVNQDEENIKKLMNLGFSYKNSKEAYISCDRNFDLALNFLLEN